MAKQQGKRRAKSEVIEILRRLKASDLTIAAFAREEGLSISTLGLWRKRYRGEVSVAQLTRAGTISGAALSSVIEVLHPSSCRVRIPGNLPPESLEAALRAVLSCSA